MTWPAPRRKDCVARIAQDTKMFGTHAIIIDTRVRPSEIFMTFTHDLFPVGPANANWSLQPLPAVSAEMRRIGHDIEKRLLYGVDPATMEADLDLPLLGRWPTST